MFEKFFTSRKKVHCSEELSKNLPIPKNFSEAFNQKHWDELFSDNTPVSIFHPSIKWLALPDQQFIDYIINKEQLGFDYLPPNKELYKKQPTFMISQIHRLWVTTKLILHIMENRKDFSILDVGAFPFSIEIILRDYLKFQGNIYVTTNRKLKDSWIKELKDRNIEIHYVNLDPFVKPGVESLNMKDHIDLADNSIDLAISTHVIEHLYHPYTMFNDINRLLKPNGRLLVTTDNAFMLSTVLNLCNLNDWIHEPIEDTAAMKFNQWRAHNRFFSHSDIKVLLEKSEFTVLQTEYYEIFYNSFSDDFFNNPITTLPKWKADILTWIPGYRNEIAVIAQKSAS